MLSISDFLKVIIPGIVFLTFGIVFLTIASICLYLVKGFFQKRGRIVGKIIFNGHEQYAVIVVNDNINSIENVVNTIMSIDISEKMAIDFMFRIHEEGITVIWTGSRNEAVQYSQTLQQNGLRCFMAAIQE
jgi:ATP-dependent Clp protease adapter protein ClpS